VFTDIISNQDTDTAGFVQHIVCRSNRQKTGVYRCLQLRKHVYRCLSMITDV